MARFWGQTSIRAAAWPGRASGADPFCPYLWGQTPIQTGKARRPGFGDRLRFGQRPGLVVSAAPIPFAPIFGDRPQSKPAKHEGQGLGTDPNSGGGLAWSCQQRRSLLPPSLETDPNPNLQGTLARFWGQTLIRAAAWPGRVSGADPFCPHLWGQTPIQTCKPRRPGFGDRPPIRAAGWPGRVSSADPFSKAFKELGFSMTPAARLCNARRAWMSPWLSESQEAIESILEVFTLGISSTSTSGKEEFISQHALVKQISRTSPLSKCDDSSHNLASHPAACEVRGVAIRSARQAECLRYLRNMPARDRTRL